MRSVLAIVFYLSSICVCRVHSQAVSPKALDYQVDLILPAAIAALGTTSQLIEDSRGNVWFASLAGFTCYDGHKLLSYNHDPDLDELTISTAGPGYKFVYQQNTDTVWLVESNNDIVQVDLLQRKEIQRIPLESPHLFVTLKASNHGKFYQVSRVDSAYYLRCISCGEREHRFIRYGEQYYDAEFIDDDLWLNTQDRLSRTDLARDTNYFYPSEVVHLGMSDDTLWSNYTRDNTLRYYNPLEDLFDKIDLPRELRQEPYKMVLHGNDIWLMDKQKLLIWNRRTGEIQDYSKLMEEKLRSENPSLLKHQIAHPLFLKNGNVLISTLSAIILLSPRDRKADDFLVTDRSIDRLASYREITEDPQGNIYASYYSNISVKTKEQNDFLQFPHTADQNHYNHAYSLQYWQDHLIWNNQIVNIGSGRKEYILDEDLIPHAETYLHEDTLWLMSWYDLRLIGYHLKNRETLYEIAFDIFTDHAVSDMKYDTSKRQLWLAIGFWLYMVDEQKKVTEVLNLGPETAYRDYERINTLHLEDSILYFGSSAGLAAYHIERKTIQNQAIKLLTANDKVINREVYSILPIENDQLLLGTSHGLCLYDMYNKSYRCLDANHPLSLIEFNRNSAFQASDSQFYFGSINGLYSFRLDEMDFENNSDISDIQFNRIKVFNSKKTIPSVTTKELADVKTIKLQSTDNRINLDYSSPSIGKEIYYQHRISEINNSWSDYSQDGEIELLSLPPGTYNLEIRAYHTPESENFASTTIEIIKPKIWYNRRWVQLLFILALGSLIALLVRWRYTLLLNNQKRIEKLRQKISSDLHDDVGTMLAGVAMRSELLAYKDFDDSKSMLLDVASKSQEAMVKMRDIVWALDSRKDSYADLILRMRSFAEKMLQAKDIDHKFHVDRIDLDQFIDPEKRRNIYLIFKECITNICRHSNADLVQIIFKENSSGLSLIVHDNGSMISKVAPSGLGISNIHQRAKEIGGTVYLDNTEGFKVSVELKND